MARRRKGRPVSGWLCLDKGIGITSTQAVTGVRRLFNAAKAGHAGTLDPLATGILPIALGEATKTVSIVQAGRKIYRFAVTWGAETTTDDAEGEASQRSDLRPEADAIRAILPRFTGEIMQRPPAFSAVKVDGERAYDLAREGAPPVLDARPVQIERLVLSEQPGRDTAIFECACGAGTYVRALARDMGRELRCFGHVTGLRRLEVGPFDGDGAVTLDDLATARGESGPEVLDPFLRPVGFGLAGLPEIVVDAKDAAKLGRGQAVLLRGRDAPHDVGTAHATHAGVTIAIGEVSQGAFHPRRVFVS